MEEGSLRCDANISLRKHGAAELGTRTELKNLNSFRNVQRALEFEIARQAAVLDAGGEVVQQTVLWDADAGETRPMRGKEEAHDYRYFPEPDLLPLIVDQADVERVRAEIPELPAERKARLIATYALTPADAHQLTLDQQLSALFEEVAELSGNPRSSANYILNDLLREQKNTGGMDEPPAVSARHLADLIRLVDAGSLSHSAARSLVEPLLRTGKPPAELMKEAGLEQLHDESALRALVREVVAKSPKEVEKLRAGRKNVFGFLVGEVMKASGGKANPVTVKALLEEALAE
jgi:aspartyl-tRNA(Asn)/glutamyl-tRNA(Gln) amidotransferase subunit B